MVGSKSGIRELIMVLVVVCSTSTFARIPPTKSSTCNEKCGDVTIPYPFGMSEECYLQKDFLITCNTSFNPPMPFLQKSNINVTKISLDGKLHVLTYIARSCFDNSGTDPLSASLYLKKFSINDTLNKFVVVGCDSYGYLRGPGFTTGCISICNNTDHVSDENCDGVGCCKTSIPKNMLSTTLTRGSFKNHSDIKKFNPCTYAFVIEDESFKFSKANLTNLRNRDKLPRVLAWSIGNETCEEAKKDETSYACKDRNSYCYDVPDGYYGYRCSCLKGFKGNPYLPNGCQDINECEDEKNECTYKKLCDNINGSYRCSCPKGHSGEGRGKNGCTKNQNMKILYILIGVAVGIIFLLLTTYLLYLEHKRRKSNRKKQMFFRQNGGILLQEKLKKGQGSLEMAKIFSSFELEKATNNFHNDMIVGQGGFGTVYKGFLSDKRVVAIKRSKQVGAIQVEQFVNEVMVLSQINHRNVVRFLGCCLENESPLLVYEFINNGTLSEHINNKVKAHSLSWVVRLKIAIETAGVLSYLHSVATTPIIHRDVKSDNILLDDAFTAKVSDFGASRLVPMDHNQLSTMVQGTFGYLDPEYLQTSQLTEKSDVYSFGVVLLELLTGRRAVSFDRPENEKILANFFLSMLKQERLFHILDDNVVCERNMEQIIGVAQLAKECLNVNGEDRPTMRQVAMELEGLKFGRKHAWAQNAENPEEIESLLGTIHDGIIDDDDGNNRSIGYDSMRNHVLSPMSGGR